MKSLQETILSIQNKYIQGLIELNDYDFSTRQNIISKQPTFLFRGERTKWKETKSTASRKNLLVSPTFDEINYWISGLHKISGQTLNNYSLYMFLRTVLNTDNVELIGGLLQHYEFDTSFIDLTSDINVAAFFASAQGDIGDIGQILIIPTSSIENRIFDLSKEFGNRPTRQKAYAILAPPELDLKSDHFKKNYQLQVEEFELTKEDKKIYDNPNLLSTMNDTVASSIFDWFESHIHDNHTISILVKEYFTEKIDNLKKHCD